MIKRTIALTGALALMSSTAWGGVIFGDGGSGLQGVLDGITTAPVLGDSTVDVVNDQITNDELCGCFSAMGLAEVSAFLASGNVIFRVHCADGTLRQQQHHGCGC